MGFGNNFQVNCSQVARSNWKLPRKNMEKVSPWWSLMKGYTLDGNTTLRCQRRKLFENVNYIAHDKVLQLLNNRKNNEAKKIHNWIPKRLFLEIQIFTFWWNILLRSTEKTLYLAQSWERSTNMTNGIPIPLMPSDCTNSLEEFSAFGHPTVAEYWPAFKSLSSVFFR